jgi:hypothetical protein
VQGCWPLQVAEVLAYTVENQVHTFVEPVLELCAALLATYAPPPGAPLTPLGESARQGAWPLQGFPAPGCRPERHCTAPLPKRQTAASRMCSLVNDVLENAQLASETRRPKAAGAAAA